MEKLGFCSRWIGWIKNCLRSSTISILMNRSLTGKFKPEKGLRQGNPLAPFLFLIAVEGLIGGVRQEERKGLIEGVNVGRNEIIVSMLQYADDTMFICKASLKNVLTIKSLLRCFEFASGLKVNLHK